MLVAAPRESGAFIVGLVALGLEEDRGFDGLRRRRRRAACWTGSWERHFGRIHKKFY